MTLLGRFGGWLLLLFGAGLTAYGLVESRDVVVLAGACLVAAGVALDRVRVAPPRETAAAAVKAQVRRDIEERVAEHFRRARDN